MPFSSSHRSLAFLAAVATAHVTAGAVLFAVRRLRRKTYNGDDVIPPKTILDFEAAAQTKLSPLAKVYFGYVDGLGVTVNAARDFFHSVRLLPRILAGDLSKVDTGLTIFGTRLELPVLVAPTAFHVFACPEGEIATARGAGEAGAGYCYNWMLANKRCEAVAREHGVKWLHLYMFEEKDIIEKALKNAEATGQFSAVILTCDHPHTRVQKRMLPLWKTLPYPPNVLDETFFTNQADVGHSTITSRELFSRDTPVKVPSATNCPCLAWDDVRWIKSLTSLPVVVKGILSVGDARRAVSTGADAIVVSNHGGRQFDGAPPAIEALPSVIAAVGNQIPVFVDTGVRTSTDVVKALCMGATGVLLGRPPLWALACGGSDGLRTMLDTLRDDIRADMMSLGVTSLSELGSHLIWPPDRERLDASVFRCNL